MKTKLEENILRMICAVFLILFYVILLVIMYHIFKARTIRIQLIDAFISYVVAFGIMNLIIIPRWVKWGKWIYRETLFLVNFFIATIILLLLMIVKVDLIPNIDKIIPAIMEIIP